MHGCSRLFVCEYDPFAYVARCDSDICDRVCAARESISLFDGLSAASSAQRHAVPSWQNPQDSIRLLAETDGRGATVDDLVVKSISSSRCSCFTSKLWLPRRRLVLSRSIGEAGRLWAPFIISLLSMLAISIACSIHSQSLLMVHLPQPIGIVSSGIIYWVSSVWPCQLVAGLIWVPVFLGGNGTASIDLD